MREQRKDWMNGDEGRGGYRRVNRRGEVTFGEEGRSIGGEGEGVCEGG